MHETRLFKASEATLALVYLKVTGFDATDTQQNHSRDFLLIQCPKKRNQIPLKMQCRHFLMTFPFLGSQNIQKPQWGRISKEVLSQDFSYRREAVIPSLLSEAQQFYGLLTPLSNRHTFFIFTNKLCISTTKKKWKSSVAFPWISPPCFQCLELQRCACQLIQELTHHTDCSPPHPQHRKGLSQGLAKPSQGAAPPGTPCTAPLLVCEETQSSSFASPTILLVTSLCVEG